MTLIYHVVSEADWSKQAGQSTYEAASLRTEGFIHFSKREQVAGVLSRYYTGVPGLLLLHVDAAKLTPDLNYEAATNNELFPHLYGPLNKDAVVQIEPLTHEIA